MGHKIRLFADGGDGVILCWREFVGVSKGEGVSGKGEGVMG